MEEVKTATLTGVWKKLIPTLMDDFEGNSVEEVTADELEVVRKLESGVKSEEVNNLLQPHDKT